MARKKQTIVIVERKPLPPEEHERRMLAAGQFIERKHRELLAKQSLAANKEGVA